MAKAGGRRRVRHDVADLMTLLGDSDTEVALRLSADGVKGHPGSETDCAIAVYLGGTLSEDRCIRALAVSGRAVWVHRRRSLMPVVVRVPGPVGAFIRGFDRGEFPQLEAPSGDSTRVSWAARQRDIPRVVPSGPDRWLAGVAPAGDQTTD
ncbi:MAG: hypothetical protein J2P57_01010 [Acidimicrobiaceae bacterium]|nr:hypothetical protein [Acidimicrobiaceae bacterium]